MHIGTNKSVGLSKLLKINAYIPNLVEEIERGEKASVAKTKTFL